ncbi:uncharacterized protein NPIL_416601 [Nephila pilipes]|uniref:Uncharacterized protein n=1 Tax=Nephila pilipes TaxID=299642 RepID=A0A8X6TT08_NEPPI|nr:uncharacterized protein NPIL_416601 [Nephila pilipes]
MFAFFKGLHSGKRNSVNNRLNGFSCIRKTPGTRLRLFLVCSSRSPCDLRTHFPCRTTPSICIELSRVRDGRTDCPDGSDEGKRSLAI